MFQGLTLAGAVVHGVGLTAVRRGRLNEVVAVDAAEFSNNDTNDQRSAPVDEGLGGWEPVSAAVPAPVVESAKHRAAHMLDHHQRLRCSTCQQIHPLSIGHHQYSCEITISTSPNGCRRTGSAMR